MPHCTFKTNDVPEALAIALITSLAHRPSAPLNTGANPALTITRVPKLQRPKIDIAVTIEEWNVFTRRWGPDRLRDRRRLGTLPALAVHRNLTLGTACSRPIPTRPLKLYPTYSLPCARSLTVIPVAPCVLRTELLQLRQARDCQIARPALVSGPPVRKLLRHYGGETRHVIWKLNFARESGNCVVVRSCGLDRVCRLSVDHRNFTWIDVDEFFKCRREYRILKYEHYVHFTCAEYNALIIETFTFLDTGNIYKKRS